MGSDAGKGLSGACAELDLTQATARHSHGEFTPVQKLSKTKVPQAAVSALQKVKRKKPLVKKTGAAVKLVRGDQRCVSLAAKIKNQLRRQNKLGRLKVPSATHHVDPRSALWLANRPGMVEALRALSVYRQAMQDTVPQKLFLA